MKIGVFGTGMVGEAIASKLVALGHEVMMGSRQSGNPKATDWVKRSGPRAKAGTFEEAAKFGELVFNCTNGANSTEALRSAGESNLGSKVLVDVANILPPDPKQPEALGEQIQRAFPKLKVVKTLHTVNCQVMIDPTRVRGSHSIFVCGNDEGAKKTVHDLLVDFGWKDIIDLGDITRSRGTEAYLLLWLDLWQKLGTPDFNLSIVRRTV